MTLSLCGFVSAAQNVTVEEILNAYRQACQKLCCKPIPKVLKQIQVTRIYSLRLSHLQNIMDIHSRLVMHQKYSSENANETAEIVV